MIENIGPGIIRVAFKGEKPFNLSEIGMVFTLIEEIYVKFSKQIFESDNFCLLINNVKPELAAFDLVSSTIDCKPIKHSDFEEITICFLYSFYSSGLEQDLELFDESAQTIHNSVTRLIKAIKPGQTLVLASSIDDKCIKISIQTNNSIKLEKLNTKATKFEFNNREQILEAYNKGCKTAFRAANLDQFDLSGMDLSGTDFSDASLFETKLNNANLSNVDFYNADVSNAMLIESNLEHSDLINADFSNANLTKAILTRTNLTSVDLSSANLQEALLDSVRLDGADLSSAILTNAVFKGNISFDHETDFGNKANWWDATIENKELLKWLEKNYPKK